VASSSDVTNACGPAGWFNFADSQARQCRGTGRRVRDRVGAALGSGVRRRPARRAARCHPSPRCAKSWWLAPVRLEATDRRLLHAPCPRRRRARLRLFGPPGNPLLIAGAGVLLVFFRVATLGRTVALPLSRFIGWPLPRPLRDQGAARPRKRHAQPKAYRSDRVCQSVFRHDHRPGVHRRLRHHVAGWPRHRRPGPETRGLVERAARSRRGRPGIRAGVAEIDGSATQFVAASDEAFAIVDVDPVAGSPADLVADTIAVFEDVAKDKDLQRPAGRVWWSCRRPATLGGRGQGRA
jgi:hypothetical protein